MIRRMAHWGLALACAGLLWGQANIEPRARPAGAKDETLPRPDLRVDTTLVLVPVSVDDPLNRPVTGLEKENFRIYEDRVEQKIVSFSSEDEPIAVGLVFDTSGSMGEKLQRSRMAASEFFKFADPSDEYFLVEFDNTPRLEVPLTRDTGRIEEQLTFSRSHRLHLAAGRDLPGAPRNEKVQDEQEGPADHLRRRRQPQPLHGDGINDVVRESDVLIYSIGVFGGGSTPEEMAGPGCSRRFPNRPAEDCRGRTRSSCPISPRTSGSSCATGTCWDLADNETRDGKYRPGVRAGGAAAGPAAAQGTLAVGLLRALTMRSAVRFG